MYATGKEAAEESAAPFDSPLYLLPTGVDHDLGYDTNNDKTALESSLGQELDYRKIGRGERI